MHWHSNLAVIAEVTNPNVETDWQNMLARVPKNICDDCKANLAITRIGSQNFPL